MNFQIGYDGPALDESEIDIRELAPALLSLSDLLEETNKVVNGNNAQVKVKVRGSFKRGSFHVDLSICQSLIDQLIGIGQDSKVVSAATILSLLGLNIKDTVKMSGVGLIQLIKRLRGKDVKIVEAKPDGKLKIAIGDEFIEVEEEVIKLFKSVKIRKSLETVIKKPLDQNGIDSFYSKSETELEFVVVNKDEARYFISPEDANEMKDVIEKIEQVFLQPETVPFQEGNKWRFTDGNRGFYCTIKDEEFLKKVQSSVVSFAKNDVLTVELLSRQSKVADGIKWEYEILRVINHQKGDRPASTPINYRHSFCPSINHFFYRQLHLAKSPYGRLAIFMGGLKDSALLTESFEIPSTLPIERNPRPSALSCKSLARSN